MLKWGVCVCLSGGQVPMGVLRGSVTMKMLLVIFKESLGEEIRRSLPEIRRCREELLFALMEPPFPCPMRAFVIPCEQVF